MDNTNVKTTLYACLYCHNVFDNEVERNVHQIRGHTNTVRRGVSNTTINDII
jgi:hypothetical protein